MESTISKRNGVRLIIDFENFNEIERLQQCLIDKNNDILLYRLQKQLEEAKELMK